MRVLSIDPAIRNTGYAVLEGEVKSPCVRDYGTISLPTRLSQAQALAAISQGVGNLIRQHEIDEVAVEGIIFVQSHATAIAMGAARAATLIPAAQASLPIFEYAPTRVKQALTGKGRAAKDQVAFMVRALLSLRETPAPDAADALAIGLAHLQAQDPQRAALLKPQRL